MKIFILCQTDSSESIYEPRTFNKESEAINYLRTQFLGKLSYKDLFEIGKQFNFIDESDNYSEKVAQNVGNRLDEKLRTGSIEDKDFYFNINIEGCTIDQNSAYIEYTFDHYTNYWNARIFESNV